MAIEPRTCQSPTVPIGALSAILQVSEATVRRDLEWLEKQGVLERTHGGARLSQRLPLEPDYASSAQVNEERRLFYVGLTRAQREVTITYAGKPSPFLEGLAPAQ